MRRCRLCRILVRAKQTYCDLCRRVVDRAIWRKSAQRRAWRNRRAFLKQASRYARSYRRDNRTFVCAREQQWRDDNRLLVRAYVRQWGMRNPGARRLHGAAQNARRRAFGTVTLWLLRRLEQLNIRRYGKLSCELCCKPIRGGRWSLEHKLPLVRGGSNTFRNLAVAHRRCNVQKNRRTMQEWRLHYRKELA